MVDPLASMLSGLGVELPVLGAPMAGGPSTPELVTAAGRAGSLGFLAAGYKPAHTMAEEIEAVRASGVAFGVNLFAPNPVPADPLLYSRYADALRADADALGVALPPGPPVEDDDAWADKIAELLADPVPVVSFTFGVPALATVIALQRVGSVVAQTVTSPSEARLADDSQPDLFVVQGSAAGAHSGTFTPDRPPPPTRLAELVESVRSVTGRPVIAAGGLATPRDITGVLAAGASAAMVGTVLLRTDESGASPAHKRALVELAGRRTVITRAFTGRLARGIRNDFTDRHSQDAPLGYPAVHHLTRPLRTAAAAAGDLERLHLWAGTGYAHAEAEPVAAALRRLAGDS